MFIPVIATAPPPDPATVKRELLVRRILDAATALFAEAGYHGTSIPDVMDRAGVGGGSLYRLFESKEVLINAVFRDAKGRLERALRDDLPLDLPPRALFDSFWARLTAFSRAEPVAFRFLELQDHVPYLDGESRQLELTVLAPILVACMDFQRRGVFRSDVAAGTIMAFVWGAFVGLVKAERLGYVKLGPPAFDAARDACWRAFAVEAGVQSPEPSSPDCKPLARSERKTPWKRSKRT
jgi:TetR/AcrR family transcriptional regulator, repressor of fatR-cypB operon